MATPIRGVTPLIQPSLQARDCSSCVLFACEESATLRAAAQRPMVNGSRFRYRGALGVLDVWYFESLEPSALELHSQGSFEVAHRRPVLGHRKAQCRARLAHPGGSADAVDVTVGTVRKIEIDDVGNVGNVEHARG